MYVDACDHILVNDEGRIQTGKAFWDRGCVGTLPDGSA
jgi:hypothetical protein